MEKQAIGNETKRTIGIDAQRGNILAGKALSEVLKKTLGPKGMDKMLVDRAGNITVTNDGATILGDLEIDHPIAKMIVQVSKTQESEIGDGTTTVVILAGQLLEKAEQLIDKKIHPTTIIRGYELALESVLQELDKYSKSDIIDLRQIAQTSMTGKGIENMRKKFTDIIIKAVDKVNEGQNIKLENIKIMKMPGGTVEKSEIVDGIVLNREKGHESMPDKLSHAKILLLNVPLEIKPPEHDTQVQVTTFQQMQNFVQGERLALKKMFEQIAQLKVNAIFCQQGIDKKILDLFAKGNIYALPRVEMVDMEKIARATGAKILTDLDNVGSSDLGRAGEIRHERKDMEFYTYIQECKGNAITILIRGSNAHTIDEVIRTIKDGIGVVSTVTKDKRIVPGGGAVEVYLSRKLREFAQTISGKEQIIVEKFAESLESIPETLAENAGLDPIEILTEVRQKQKENENVGLNLISRRVEDTLREGIIEPTRLKEQAISAATEVANMILRIDDILISQVK